MEGTTGATGDLFWVIFFSSSLYLLLFLPGLELAIWYREDTIPDPHLGGRESQIARKSPVGPEARGGRP